MSTVVDVQGELTVYTVHALKDRLLNALTADADLLVKLDEVTEFDGAGLQLLLAARHEAEQRGNALRLSSPSKQVMAVLQLAGLPHHFEMLASENPEITP